MTENHEASVEKKTPLANEFGEIVPESSSQTGGELPPQISDTPIAEADQGEEYGDPLKALVDLKEKLKKAVPFDASQIQKND